MDARPNLSRMPTLRPHRARPLRSLALPTTLALLLALAGCSNTAEIPRADPSPSTSPLFASEDEALEAATAVYEEYLAVTGEILQDGGSEPDRIREVISDAISQSEMDALEIYRANGWTATSAPLLESAWIQQIAELSESSTEVSMYACVDYSQVDVLDGNGQSVVGDDRQPFQTFEASIEFEDGTAILTRNILWEQGTKCGS